MWDACYYCDCQGAQFWQWFKSRCSPSKRLVSCGQLHPVGDKEVRERPHTGGSQLLTVAEVIFGRLALCLELNWRNGTGISEDAPSAGYSTGYAVGRRAGRKGMEYTGHGKGGFEVRGGIRWMWDRGQPPPAVMGWLMPWRMPAQLRLRNSVMAHSRCFWNEWDDE